MGKTAEPTPGDLSQAVAEELRREMGAQRMSARELARQVGKSNGYITQRLAGNRSFDLTDFERICLVLGLDPIELLRKAASASHNSGEHAGLTTADVAAIVKSEIAALRETDSSSAALDSDYGARHIVDEIDEETLAAIRAARESGVGLAALEFDPREQREEDWSGA